MHLKICYDILNKKIVFENLWWFDHFLDGLWRNHLNFGRFAIFCDENEINQKN